jgi:hypothetical protein
MVGKKGWREKERVLGNSLVVIVNEICTMRLDLHNQEINKYPYDGDI